MQTLNIEYTDAGEDFSSHNAREFLQQYPWDCMEEPVALAESVAAPMLL
jgi:hypothetical protein